CCFSCLSSGASTVPSGAWRLWSILISRSPSCGSRPCTARISSPTQASTGSLSGRDPSSSCIQRSAGRPSRSMRSYRPPSSSPTATCCRRPWRMRTRQSSCSSPRSS
ncbi:PPF-1, partial [Symbiodinium necroappetens]